MVSVLTGAGDGEEDTGRVPRANAGNLAETLVGLAWELLGAPPVGDTLETVALGDAENVDHLGLLEDLLDGDGLLHVLLGPGNLGGRVGATVELDLHDVRLLLLEVLEEVDLGVRDDADNLAVLGLEDAERAGEGQGACERHIQREKAERANVNGRRIAGKRGAGLSRTILLSFSS